RWWPKVAMSAPRYDRHRAVGGKCYLTVAVANVAEWRTVGAAATWVNWPAEAVREVAAQTAGKEQG
ncbi:MAG TPA: hypothetical protein VHA75_06650, partial [Rugosimonospora sp.]|nr:hypothetical protein [Rugosimonospora sp.]